MNWDELQHHLEPENIGNAPMSVKLGVFAFSCSSHYRRRHLLRYARAAESTRAAREKGIELKNEFKVKAEQAAKLEFYKEQLAEMEASFGALLRQLPETTEVESLLVDVSQTGLAAGSRSQEIQAQRRREKRFLCRTADRARGFG